MLIAFLVFVFFCIIIGICFRTGNSARELRRIRKQIEPRKPGVPLDPVMPNRKWLPWVGGIVVTLFAAFFLLGKSNDEHPAGSSPQQSGQVESKPEPTPTPPATPEPEPKKTYWAICPNEKFCDTNTDPHIWGPSSDHMRRDREPGETYEWNPDEPRLPGAISSPDDASTPGGTSVEDFDKAALHQTDNPGTLTVEEYDNEHSEN